MSVYIIYKGYVGILEVKRIVVFNIYVKGILVVEVGVYIVYIIKKVLDVKVSG